MNQTDKKYTEIIWYGRGGQGAITASKIIAEAAAIDGYRGITTAPSFGAERRGAPVAAFLRLSQEPIRVFSRINDPDIIIILDPTLLSVLNLNNSTQKTRTLIINSTETPDKLEIENFSRTGIADVTRIALENNLTAAGVPILNTPILGAFVKITELIDMNTLEKAIIGMFGTEKGAQNMKCAKNIYDSTTIYETDGRIQ